MSVTTTSYPLTSADVRYWLKLNTILDSIKYNALYTYKTLEGAEQREQFVSEIESNLEMLRVEFAKPACQPGWYDCGGWCSQTPCDGYVEI